MNALVESLAYWLADFYLAGTVLLAAALAAMAMCRQPAKRLAVAKAAIVAAALLAGLCALPGWSVISLGGVGATDAANRRRALLRRRSCQSTMYLAFSKWSKLRNCCHRNLRR